MFGDDVDISLKRSKEYREEIKNVVVNSYKLIKADLNEILHKVEKAFSRLPKSNMVIRPIYQLLSEERTEDIRNEIIVAMNIPKIERYFHYLIKTTTKEKIKRFSAELVYSLRLLPYFK